MGGWGSGRRWHFGAKELTGDYRQIDVRRWQREGFLEPHQNFGWQWSWEGEKVASIGVATKRDRVILTYKCRRNGEDWKDMSYPVGLDWTPCNFGGWRPWFRCPVRGCGRRVAILYGGEIFACRQCFQLAYPCQREVYFERWARRANKIRARLGWEPGILNGKGWEKPKSMHWRTFKRLVSKHDDLAEASLHAISSRFVSRRGP